jgi:iron uptake system EfeUOB component EfeO/EfeM
MVTVLGGCLVVAGCSAARHSSAPSSTASSSAGVRVTLTAAGCEPGQIRTAPGMVHFAVTNHGTAAGTFAVIEGDRAIGQLEGLATGASTSLVLDLGAGVYRTACQAGSSAGGGSLLVGASDDAPALGQAADLLSATATYRRYLLGQVTQLATSIGDLRGALASGDLASARAAYLTARLTYSRVKVAADNFGDALLPGQANLDEAIDPPPGGARRGLPLVAAGLWAGSTNDLPAAVDDLQSQVVELQRRLASMHLDAVAIGAGTSGALGELVSSELIGGAEPASHLDLLDAEGVVEGAQAVWASLRDPVAHRNGRLAAEVSTRLELASRQVAALKGPAGFPATASVPAGTLRQLAEEVDAAADSFSQVPAALTRPATS